MKDSMAIWYVTSDCFLRGRCRFCVFLNFWRKSFFFYQRSVSYCLAVPRNWCSKYSYQTLFFFKYPLYDIIYFLIKFRYLVTGFIKYIMRQLKGKVKETNKQKKERKKDFVENKKKIFSLVLPTVGAIFLLIVVYVYLKTRPKAIEEY